MSSAWYTKMYSLINFLSSDQITEMNKNWTSLIQNGFINWFIKKIRLKREVNWTLLTFLMIFYEGSYNGCQDFQWKLIFFNKFWSVHTKMIHYWKLQSMFIAIEWKKATGRLFNNFSFFVKKGIWGWVNYTFLFLGECFI